MPYFGIWDEEINMVIALFYYTSTKSDSISVKIQVSFGTAYSEGPTIILLSNLTLLYCGDNLK